MKQEAWFGFPFQAIVYYWWKPEQESKQELEAETIEEHHLLDHSQAYV